MCLGSLGIPPVLDEANAQRMEQKAATNMYEDAQVVDSEIGAAQYGNFWDSLISGDNESSHNLSEGDFNFADNEHPGDADDTDLNQALSD